MWSLAWAVLGSAGARGLGLGPKTGPKTEQQATPESQRHRSVTSISPLGQPKFVQDTSGAWVRQGGSMAQHVLPWLLLLLGAAALPLLLWRQLDVLKDLGTRDQHSQQPSLMAALHDRAANAWAGGVPDTLVVYVFSATDPEYLNNLRFFVREAIQSQAAGQDRCDYVIIVQQDRAKGGGPGIDAAAAAEVAALLPDLPANARYVNHTNECYDWGTFGWLLGDSGQVDPSKYKYFIFMNSSVRGPFVPPALRGSLHWTDPLISRLVGDVRLVGPTISCEGSPYKGDKDGEWRKTPHVQSYLVATDREGLRVLQADGGVLACHSDRWDAIWHSELGSSHSILRAGYNLDCLMMRYQGVDWRKPEAAGCNGERSPAGDAYYDGTDLGPYEVMFVKYKSYFAADQGAARKASKYQSWAEHQHQQAQQRQHEEQEGRKARKQPPRGAAGQPQQALSWISRNEYLQHLDSFRAPAVLAALDRGPHCFDFDTYLQESPDLLPLASDIEQVWLHWVEYGQFEGRAFKFTCPRDYSQYAEVSAGVKAAHGSGTSSFQASHRGSNVDGSAARNGKGRA